MTRVRATPDGDEALSPAQEAARDAEEATSATASFERSKANKRTAFISEGIKRITVQVPEWDNYERVALLASVWNMLDGASATTAQSMAEDIYLYVKNTALPMTHSEIITA